MSVWFLTQLTVSRGIHTGPLGALHCVPYTGGLLIPLVCSGVARAWGFKTKTAVDICVPAFAGTCACSFSGKYPDSSRRKAASRPGFLLLRRPSSSQCAYLPSVLLSAASPLLTRLSLPQLSTWDRKQFHTYERLIYNSSKNIARPGVSRTKAVQLLYETRLREMKGDGGGI